MQNYTSEPLQKFIGHILWHIHTVLSSPTGRWYQDFLTDTITKKNGLVFSYVVSGYI